MATLATITGHHSTLCFLSNYTDLHLHATAELAVPARITDVTECTLIHPHFTQCSKGTAAVMLLLSHARAGMTPSAIAARSADLNLLYHQSCVFLRRHAIRLQRHLLIIASLRCLGPRE
jgi:hypothetical protein